MSPKPLIQLSVHLYVHSVDHPKRTPPRGALRAPGCTVVRKRKKGRTLNCPHPITKASGVLAVGDAGSVCRGCGEPVMTGKDKQSCRLPIMESTIRGIEDVEQPFPDSDE